MQAVSSTIEDIEVRDRPNLKEEITRLNSQGSDIAFLEKKLENVQKSIDKLVLSLADNEESPESETPESKAKLRKKKVLPFTLSNSTNRSNMSCPPCSPLSSSRKVMEYGQENMVLPEYNDFVCGGDVLIQPIKTNTPQSEDSNGIPSNKGTPGSCQSKSLNMKKMQKMFKNAAEENIRNIRTYVTELKERVAKLQYQKQLLVCQVSNLSLYIYTPLQPAIRIHTSQQGIHN
uniref:Uncharacterized protein n=1 Tax=Nelumbo nucifera TaxID=4432 RepID=A0A822ZGB1_NELNU|nr:TPA_asm: hypothetical protein HUJ06_002402 [Nelumbo nucifera]